jgi:hypothetical protein
MAPDFDLPTTSGGRFRLGARRGKTPVLLTFGSLTCPQTIGAVAALKDVAREFRGRIELVTVYVRELHPGERRPQPRSLLTKMSRAREWIALDGVTWTVAVDRLDGETHRAYGSLPAPAFLVDSTGRITARWPTLGSCRSIAPQVARLLNEEGWGGASIQGEQGCGPAGPILRAIALDRALGRGGHRARADHRREMGRRALDVARVLRWLGDLVAPVHVRPEVRVTSGPRRSPSLPTAPRGSGRGPPSPRP